MFGKFFGKSHRHEFIRLGILVAIGLLGMGIDRLWLAIDHAAPSWDPADNLTNALNFSTLPPHWFSGGWWTAFWQRSSKYPPLLFALTALLENFVGKGADQALLVNLGFSAVLLLAVYQLGKHLFSPQVGLWAAGLCLLLPRLYTNRIHYFMDFPLTAIVALSFCALTFWRDERDRLRQWLWGLSFGICFGLAVLTKQSALLFLLVPILWVGIPTIWRRQWERLLQLVSGLLLTLAIDLPWVSTNWLFQISAGFNSNVKSALAEGDPPLNTWRAWAYYWNDLPQAVSLPLLVVPIAGIGLSAWRRLPAERRLDRAQVRSSFGWLAVFWLGSYLIWSGVVNKDLRYIMPYLPIVAIGLAYGLTRWSDRWRIIPWATVSLATVLMLLNLFPLGIGAGLTQALAPGAQSPPDRSIAPHAEIIDAVIRAQPDQIANIGMLASSPTVNQHTFNYYGNLRDFQVYSRQMGRSSRQVESDLRTLSWFITLQDRSRRDENDPRTKTIRAIEQSPDYQLQKSWRLSSKSQINLYHRPLMPVEVQPLATGLSSPSAAVRLDRLTLPPSAPPDAPLAVTYEWSGTGAQLQSGIVLLTWRHQSNAAEFWIHDHQMGLGSLYLRASKTDAPFKVIERTAMLIPSRAAGAYRLEAAYLNVQTGETYPIAVPPTTLTLDPAAPQLAAPEPDRATQFRELAMRLPAGRPKLDRIFSKIAQLNMYDSRQSYVTESEKILTYRLQQEPHNRDYAYGVALAKALQQQIEPTIAALEQVVRLDPQNPNAYAYLAAVNLFALRPAAAQAALRPALLAPSPELQALDAVAALMRGNLWKAWQQRGAITAIGL